MSAPAGDHAGTFLILGGAGMVGLQVAREALRELHPKRIVVSALTQQEVDEAVAILSAETPVPIEGAAGDVFIPQSLQGVSREERLDREHFDELFSGVFPGGTDAYERSMLAALIRRYQPEWIVDCINTATAIAYLDVFTISDQVKHHLDAIENRDGVSAAELQPLIKSVRELLIAQGIPQITRHIIFLERALKESNVRVYVKVGTTGTGGMGFNIPYTHSEDKPSATLISKSAIGFAHTGLLFLLARTPGESIIKEIKPGAMIGFKQLQVRQVRVKRQPALLTESRDEVLGDTLQTDGDGYGKFEGRDIPIRIVGADTGENGFFSIGEFQAITYPRQMEAVTPEEVARTVVLEIVGNSTGRDVITAIDGAITEPSYRAGFLRSHAVVQMLEMERNRPDDVLPSIAVGQLGPPRLSKLLVEAFLLREVLGDRVSAMLEFSATEMQTRVEEYLAKNPRVVSMITTIGIPFLRDEPLRLTRGPRINIPPKPVQLDAERIDGYARTGWVDLRRGSFEQWRRWIADLAGSQPNIQGEGSAAFDEKKYFGDVFVPGDVVGWIFNREGDLRLF